MSGWESNQPNQPTVPVLASVGATTLSGGEIVLTSSANGTVSKPGGSSRTSASIPAVSARRTSATAAPAPTASMTMVMRGQRWLPRIRCRRQRQSRIREHRLDVSNHRCSGYGDYTITQMGSPFGRTFRRENAEASGAFDMPTEGSSGIRDGAYVFNNQRGQTSHPPNPDHAAHFNCVEFRTGVAALPRRLWARAACNRRAPEPPVRLLPGRLLSWFHSLLSTAKTMTPAAPSASSSRHARPSASSCWFVW